MTNKHITTFGSIFLILTACELLFTPLVLAKDTSTNEPTSDNWQTFEPEICKPSPKDSYNLRPVIFPPKFETYLETLPPLHTPTELIRIPEYINEQGDHIPEHLVERIVPDMRHPKTLRAFADKQLIGFLNTENELVNMVGLPISENIKIERFSTAITVHFKDKNTSEIVWERPLKNDRTEIKLTEKFERQIKNSENCSYVIGNTSVITLQYLDRKAQRNSQYKCRDEGGFFLLPPVLIEQIRTRQVVNRPDGRLYWLKDHNGEIRKGVIGNRPAYFKKVLADAKYCDWRPAGQIIVPIK